MAAGTPNPPLSPEPPGSNSAPAKEDQPPAGGEIYAPAVAPPPTNVKPLPLTPGEQARQNYAQENYEAQAKAAAPTPRSTTTIKDQQNPDRANTGFILTNATTLLGGDNGIKASEALHIGRDEKLSTFINVTVHDEQSVSTPLGEISLTVDSSWGMQSLNGSLSGTYNTTFLATRDIAGDTDETGFGLTVRAEHSKDGQMALISGDPSKDETRNFAVNTGAVANVQQKFEYVTFTGSLFGGLESQGLTARPYAEASVALDGKLVGLKYTFNGIAIGTFNTTYHAAATATTHGVGWESGVYTTVLSSKFGDLNASYQRSGGPGSSVFGPDTGVPNNGFSASFRPHLPSLLHRKR